MIWEAVPNSPRTGEKVKKLEERCENIETDLQELYNKQIDHEYVYNKLVDKINPEDATCRLMVLLKERWNLGVVSQLTILHDYNIIIT